LALRDVQYPCLKATCINLETYKTLKTDFEMIDYGKYRTTLKSGTYLIQIPEIKFEMVINLPIHEEYRNLEVNINKIFEIAKISGGKVIKKPQEIKIRPPTKVVSYLSLKTVFVILALLLFVFDLFLQAFKS
jgi:hypothetical protein